MSNRNLSMPFDGVSRRIRRYEARFLTGTPRTFLLLKLLCFTLGEFTSSLANWALSLFQMKRKKGKRLKIVVSIIGGVGDLIQNVQYIRKLALKTATTSDVYLYSEHPKACVEGVFGCNPEFFPKNLHLDFSPKIFDDADLVFNFSRSPHIVSYDKSRIQKKDPWLVEYLNLLFNFFAKVPCFSAPEGTAFDAIAMQICGVLGKNRREQAEVPAEIPIPSAEFKLKTKISEKEVRDKFSLTNQPYITLQRGVQFSADGTRCWSIARYEEFVAKFKARFPTVSVVQVGAGTTTYVQGVDFDLRGKTSFEELKALLKHDVFHLDGECGMVHLKHILGGRSVVLFGPTDENFLGYPDNINISNRPCRKVCEWLAGDWQNYCLRTRSPTALCMNRISVEMVIAAIEQNFAKELDE